MDESEKGNKEILIKDKKIDGEDELLNEPKTFLNCCCCKISVGIILTYIYIFLSIFLNLNNRIIYHKYNFKNNFTLLLLQQFFSMILFSIFSSKSEIFKKQTGEISFNDFYKFKYYYIFFCTIFICNMLSSFYGNQLILNVSMYVTLRKLVLVINKKISYIIHKRK